MACKVSEKDGFIHLEGILDGTVDLKAYADRGDLLRFQLQALTGANSVGLSRLLVVTNAKKTPVAYYNAPLFFLSTLTTIRSLLGPGGVAAVQSFVGEFHCLTCGGTSLVPMPMASVKVVGQDVVVPPAPCGLCRHPAEIDELTRTTLEDFLIQA